MYSGSSSGPSELRCVVDVDTGGDEHEVKVRRFRGRELAVWGDDLSLWLGGELAPADLSRLLIGWEGQMLTWRHNQIRVIELGEHEPRGGETVIDSAGAPLRADSGRVGSFPVSSFTCY